MTMSTQTKSLGSGEVSDRCKLCKDTLNYPYSPFVDYKQQTEQYFHTVRGLPNKGRNPYFESRKLPVSEKDLIKVFGCAKTFRAKNDNLDPTTSLDLTKLYWQCCGTDHVTNSEYQFWFVKGYLAQEKRVEVK